MFNVQEKINNYSVFEFGKLIDELKIINDTMLKCFIQEKNYAYMRDAETVNYVRVAQYIEFSELIMSDLLHRIIISYQGMNQLNSLNSILMILGNLKDISEKYVSDNTSIFVDLKLDNEGNTESFVTQAFCLYMQYWAYAEEVKQIEELLIEDINANKEHFYSYKPFKYLFLDEYGKNHKSALRDLKEKDTVNGDDYKKLKQAEDFIRCFYCAGENSKEENKMILLRIVFYEIFSNKARLADKNRNTTSNQLAKLVLKNRCIENRQIIFLEKKIERGFFREAQLIQEYQVYLKICQEYRNMMLLVSFLSDDIKSYEMVHDVLAELLNLVQEHATIKI